MTNIYYPYESYTSLEVPLSAEQRAIENAKNAIERKIQSRQDIDPRLKQAAAAIGKAIVEGDLPQVQRALTKHHEEVQFLKKLGNVVGATLSCPGVTFMETCVANWKFAGEQRQVEMAILSIRLNNARRTLCLTSEPRFGTKIFGPPRGQETSNAAVELAEDPRLLLKQIARVVALYADSGPPPFQTPAGK
ncbi:MAG: hypothetical protein U0105_07495 [Candidatus Obscuribacterales bacterium]